MKKIFITLCGIAPFFGHTEPIPVPKGYYYEEHNLKNHPGDFPLPTDMTFRKYANHILDQSVEYFDPDAVQLGDTIFLGDWFIQWFFENIHPQIKQPYIIISNDTDGHHPEIGIWYREPGHRTTVETMRTLLYDSKIAAWFCKNMKLSRHPKITQIPIGQNIIYWGKFPQKPQFFALIKEEKQKVHLLYMNMQLTTHPSRPYVASLFQDKPYCYSHIQQLNHNYTIRDQYLDELAKAKFTLAPPGYGLDIVRFWEAVALDCIPIVKHNELDDLFSEMPVLFIHDWEEINQQLLEQKYSEITAKKISKEKAFFPYWAKKIDQAQQAIRAKRNNFSRLDATYFPRETLQNLDKVFRENTTLHDRLICKGNVLALRPFEIARKCPYLAKIYVQDSWGSWGPDFYEKGHTHLEKFTTSPLLKETDKIEPLRIDKDISILLRFRAKSKTHVFLDLTYHRHHLKEDLENLYPYASKGTLFCGNLATDSYIQEVLQKLFNRPIQTRGDIWYIKK